MPLYIMYVNLKDGVIEEEFVKKLKESFDYNTGKVEGFGLGKLYRHHFFGTNPRTYQIHVEFKDLSTGTGLWLSLRRTLRQEVFIGNGKTS